MSMHIFTMFKCKNLMTEVTVELGSILYIEKLRSGNCKIHFPGHEEITVQESYDSVAAILSPSMLTVKSANLSKRDISSIESFNINAIGNPEENKSRHAHPQRSRARKHSEDDGE